MTFHQPGATLFVPDGQSPAAALSRVTHLGIGAHQDDLEFMAFHGIVTCYEGGADWFGGVTCTDGGGSPRTGPYAAVDDAAMRAARREEQNRAAVLGRYGAMLQLAYPSALVKDPRHSALRDDLLAVLLATRPRVVYTHNLADKHATHVAVALASLTAIRALPAPDRPAAVYGCEVWRDLDWLPDDEKIVHDLTGHDALAETLHAAFCSQIIGGKRYDLGVLGRRRANATFLASHAVDTASSLAYAMDLTPLVRDENLDIARYVGGFVDRFRRDVQARLSAHLRP